MVRQRPAARDVEIRIRRVSAAPVWVVTFDHYGIGAGFDRPGFGEPFLASANVNAVHVLGRGNDWYQYDDLPAALAEVRAATHGAERIVAYGSSMGGYAAIRFADAVGADAVLALSPQYTVDPAIVPWEVRWIGDAARIRWLPAHGGPIATSAEILLCYDPTGPDRLHAELIARDTRCDLVAIPHAGHPVATFLAAGGLLADMLLRLVAAPVDPGRARAAVARARKSNPVWLAHLAELQPVSRSRTAISLARAAVRAEPGNPIALQALGRVLTRAGDTDGALAVFADLMPRVDEPAPYVPAFAEALAAAGRVDDALAQGRALIRACPDRAHLRHWLARLLWHAGKAAEAAREQAVAVALEPGTAMYRDALRRYRSPRRRLWQKMTRLNGQLRARLRPATPLASGPERG